MANLPSERVFIKVMVDGAARILTERGKAGLKKLRDPLSCYNLPGSTTLFVVTGEGETLIAPAFQMNQPVNIIDYQDAAGHTPLREAFKRLKNSDYTWVILLAHSPDSMNMQKKGMYIRKLQMDGQTVYVATTTDLPKPSWMN